MNLLFDVFGKEDLNYTAEQTSPDLFEAAYQGRLSNGLEFDRGIDSISAMESLQDALGAFGSEYLDERAVGLTRVAARFATAGMPVNARFVPDVATGVQAAEGLGDKISTVFEKIKGFVASTIGSTSQVITHALAVVNRHKKQLQAKQASLKVKSLVLRLMRN